MNDEFNYRVEIRNLKLDEYQFLRKTTSWQDFDDAVVSKALKNDLFSLAVYHDDKLVGMGRIIGDGAIYFYVQDIIVIPAYQGKGVGNLIMENIEQYLNETAGENAFVGLMAAEGVKSFYSKFAYKERPSSKPGMYKIMPKISS